MNTLNHNYTTPEQSKHLLELGIPLDSADCYHNNIANKPFLIPVGTVFSDPRHQLDRNTLPCWSVGRLIEILEICAQVYFERNMNCSPSDKYLPLKEDVIRQIENTIKWKTFNPLRLNN